MSPARTLRLVRPGPALLAGAILLLAGGADPAAAQESVREWNCFRSWTVTTAEESAVFRVDRSPWALRWRRTTPRHTPHDGFFAELYRAEEGERTEDQVAAVNTDHDGDRGTVTVEETGAFWLSMESWSRETAWKLEACRPAKSSGRRPTGAGPGAAENGG